MQCNSRLIMFVILILGLWNICLGQKYWTKKFGNGGTWDGGIQTTADGNFIVVGLNGVDGWVSKIRQNGDTIWTKTYGGPDFDNIIAIQPMTDGNFLLAGYTKSYGAEKNQGWLLKIKPDGDTLWTRTYGGPDGYTFQEIQKTADGDFLITGNIDYGYVDVDYKMDGWLLKIKPNGDTLWTKTYSGCWFSTIRLTADGDFLLAGEAGNGFRPYADGLYSSCDGWLLRIKSNGDTLWTKTYGDTNIGIFNAIQPTYDGNFLVAGHANAPMIDTGWLVKVNPDGDTLWTKTYTGFNSLLAIQPSPDSTFLIVGGGYNPKFAKINRDGDIIWTNAYDSDFGQVGCSIQPTADGNFLIVGGPGLICIVADQYAYKDSPFAYKIPTYGADTLNLGFTTLKAPSGMTVSPGGTISWTPKTDSIYMDHAEFLVVRDVGNNDTFSFNIFVNSTYHANAISNPSRSNAAPSKPFQISATSNTGKVKFTLSPLITSLYIYDITGKLVDKVTPIVSGREAYATWPCASSRSTKIPTGKYFAKAVSGKNVTVKPFLLMR